MDVRQAIGKTLTKVFSTSSERYVKKRRDFSVEINELEAEYGQLTDDQLRKKTDEFRDYIQKNQDKIIGPSLRQRLRELYSLPEDARRPAKKHLTDQLRDCGDEIIIEAFALVREASDRFLGVRNAFNPQFQFDPATDRYEIAKLDTSWEGPIPSIYQLIDFGSFQTSVGVRVVKENERVLVAPLPNGKSAPFRLHCPSFNLSGAPVLRAEQLDGDTVTKEGLTQGDYLKWELDPAVFRYVVSQE